MITWRNGKYSTTYGSVEGVELFRIHWSSSRDHGGKPHILGSELPGSCIPANKANWATSEEAQAYAEEVLTGFLARLGGSEGTLAVAAVTRARAVLDEQAGSDWSHAEPAQAVRDALSAVDPIANGLTPAQRRTKALAAAYQLPAVTGEFRKGFDPTARRILEDMIQNPAVLDGVLRFMQAGEA